MEGAEILKTLSDYQHVLLLGLALVGWRRWKAWRAEELAEQKDRETAQVELTRRVIKESLANGIGDTMRTLIKDHEKVELAALADHMRPVHERLSALEARIGRRWFS